MTLLFALAALLLFGVGAVQLRLSALHEWDEADLMLAVVAFALSVYCAVQVIRGG